MAWGRAILAGLLVSSNISFAGLVLHPDELREQKISADYTLYAATDEIKVMNYNVENLFDATHDSGKRDYTYLPKGHVLKKLCTEMSSANYIKECYETDWTDAKLKLKLSQIKKMISAQGSLPDILTVEEIENENVAKLLASTLGYSSYVMTESPDSRGIDVALFYNENKIKFLKSEVIDLNPDIPEGVEEGGTRDALVARFKFSNSLNESRELTLIANHWPAQSAPARVRMKVALLVREWIDGDMKGSDPKNYHLMVLGDFNTTPQDDPNALVNGLQDYSWKNRLVNVQTDFEKSSGNGAWQSKMPPGSYFSPYSMSFVRLDAMFVSQNLVDSLGVEVNDSSFRIVAPDFAITHYQDMSKDDHLFASVIYGVPLRYDHNAETAERAGFSDHFPIVVKIRR